MQLTDSQERLIQLLLKHQMDTTEITMMMLMMDSPQKVEQMLEWLGQNPTAKREEVIVKAIQISPESD